MRLLTRSDFDGLVCAVLLEEAGVVDEYRFVHPKDVQDGLVEATANDVVANVPYIAGCGLWFDHHASEDERLGHGVAYQGASHPAPSCAQVIWDYYGGEETFREHFKPLLKAVNKSDSGCLNRDDILTPQGWILLSFIMDPRTGLGRFRDFRISNYQLMEDMIQYCKTMTAEEILQLADVRERVDMYLEQQEKFKDMLLNHSWTEGKVIVTDLRDCEMIFSGNRFLIYALYPEQNIEVRVMWGKQKQNVVFSVGKSILNRTNPVNVGNLLLEYGGGGHPAVGTCQIPLEHAAEALQEIVTRIREQS